MAEIDPRNKDRVATPPENSFKVIEYAKRYGISPSCAQKCLSILVTEGKLKRSRCGAVSYYTIV